MKSTLLSLLTALVATPLFAAEVGKPAPDFRNPDATGGQVSLADLKGKVVVLEWTNFDCPFVKKHYVSGNMPALQKLYTGKDVVWLTICSSAAGKQGHMDAETFVKRAKEAGGNASHLLLDADGKTGKAYDAKVTPQLFIIGKDGTLLYNGAIDSKATADAKDIASAEKYFADALDAVLAGRPVALATTKPYGCGVKY